MSDINVERLRELLAKATPGPWHWSENGNIYGGPEGRYADVDEVAAIYTNDEATGAPNAPLIIEVINALPNLLADYERLRGMEERVKGAAVGACGLFKEGALIHAATVYFDLNNPIDAQKISGQTVALVPVPGGE
jgi:hypothetical protein